MVWLFASLLLCTGAPFLHPQSSGAETSEAQRVASGLERVKRDDLGSGIVDAEVYLNDAAKAGPEAIPVLEAFFGRCKDPDKKGQAASDLVRLGDQDPRYWQFLVQQASAALLSNPPLPSMFPSSPDPRQSSYPPEFLAWSRARNLTPEAALEDVAVTLTSRLVRLARTGDPRGKPLLRQALASKTLLFQSVGALGLAAAQDHDAIPLIVRACNHAPTPGDANFIATALRYFREPEADREYRLHFPEEDLTEQQAYIGTNPWFPPASPK